MFGGNRSHLHFHRWRWHPEKVSLRHEPCDPEAPCLGIFVSLLRLFDYLPGLCKQRVHLCTTQTHRTQNTAHSTQTICLRDSFAAEIRKTGCHMMCHDQPEHTHGGWRGEHKDIIQY